MKRIWMLLFCTIMVCSLWSSQKVLADDEILKSSETQADSLSNPADLGFFLDGMMSAYMPSYHIAGAAVTVVRNGEILLSRGYGYADMAKKIKVDPESTLFRTGSTGKLITWTAVMQLVEQGKISLDRDINFYLKDFKVPSTFPEPITMKHLLTHTAGFEDVAIGLMARTPSGLVPLGRVLREKMPARIFPPGTITAYSNYGAALAGYIVEQVSGLSYEDYVEENVFKPLGMSRSSVRQPLPAALADEMAVGYKFEGGQYKPQGFELFRGLVPAGTMSSTVVDMARFMIAHLEQGSYRSGRILKESTIRLMHSRLFSSDPRISGMACGFWEYHHNQLRLLEHGGDTMYFHTFLDLIPEKKVGIYLAYSGSAVTGPSLNRIEFIRAFVDRYFPGIDSSAPMTLPGHKGRVAKCVGYYWLSRSNLTTFEKLETLFSRVRIKATLDGRLIYGNTTWTETEPLVFREDRGQDKIIFQQDASGAVSRFISSRIPPLSFLRVPWHFDPNLHLLVFAFCFLMFLSTLRWSLGPLWRRICKKNDPWKAIPLGWRLPMIGLGIMNLGFILGFISILSDPLTLIYGIPRALRILLFLPIFGVGAEAGTIATVFLAWIEKKGTICQRIYFSMLALAGLLFLWMLYYWNLLGFRF